MQKRLRIINSTKLTPSNENYIISFGVETMAMSGKHSNETYIDHCHEMNRGTLVYRR